MGPELGQLLQCESRQRTQLTIPNDSAGWLLDTMPRTHEWQMATASYFAKRRGTNNVELLAIDRLLTNYWNPGPKGDRAKAIREIAAETSNWLNRRGDNSVTSERWVAITTLHEIAMTLLSNVVYDKVALLAKERARVPTGPNLVAGGFGENGQMALDARYFMLVDILQNNNIPLVFDTNNEALHEMRTQRGLGVGPEFTGKNSCHQGQAFAVGQSGEFNRFYPIGLLKGKQSNDGSHRFGFSSANQKIVDPTWRQFFTDVQGLPAIFVGTRDDAANLIGAAGGGPAQKYRVYSTLYNSVP